MKRSLHPSTQQSPAKEEVTAQSSSRDTGEDFGTDAPIDNPTDDRFGRAPWAARIASTIAAQRDPGSLVVGVYGPWGDGKTSVLNLIKLSLAEDASIVPVYFNPWRLNDEAEVFRFFFATLAEAIDKELSTTKQKAGRALRDYGALLEPLPIAGRFNTIARTVGTRLSEASLAEQRGRVEELLRESGKRVVILIDDIDRLDKAEIQAIFRLVKVAADFKHTAYVLSFDDKVVAAALAERYGDDGDRHGSSFMDKIIQLPLHLPPAPPEALRAMALGAIDSALSQAQVDLSEADGASFVAAFDRTIVARLLTPRAAKRFGNALLFGLPMVAGEVHPGDFILIEAMRLCYPGVYDWVRRHELEALGTHHLLGSHVEPAIHASIKAGLADGTAGLSEADVARAQDLLTTLFPRTESAWQNKAWGGEWDKTWSSQKRISSGLYFRRYFTYMVPPGDTSDAEIDQLVERIVDPGSSPAERTALGLKIFEEGDPDRLVQKFAGITPTLSGQAAAGLARVVAAAADQLPDSRGFLNLSLLERGALLTRDLIGKVDRESRGDLARDLVGLTPSIRFAIELIRWLQPQDESPRDVINQVEVRAAGRVVAERIHSIWLTGDPAKEFGNAALTSLHVWAIYGADDVPALIRDRIDQDASIGLLLLRSTLGQSWSMDSGVPLTPSFRREGYNVLIEYADPGQLLGQLQVMYGENLGADEHAVLDGLPRDERLATEFAHLHRQVVNEQRDRGNTSHEEG